MRREDSNELAESLTRLELTYQLMDRPTHGVKRAKENVLNPVVHWLMLYLGRKLVKFVAFYLKILNSSVRQLQEIWRKWRYLVPNITIYGIITVIFSMKKVPLFSSRIPTRSDIGQSVTRRRYLLIEESSNMTV
jgi:hypothetical protein